MAKERRKGGKSRAARPAVEWVAGALSCALVVLLIAFLLHQAVSEGGLAPDLAVAVTAVEQAGNGTVVSIEVTNRGDAAAAAVTVHAARREVGAPGAPKTVEFDYIAGHAVRRGALVFSGETIPPDALEVGISGYVEP